MKLDEIDCQSEFKLNSILKCLESHFNYKLVLEGKSTSELKSLYRINYDVRMSYLNENLVASTHMNDITKSKLICEAIRVYLKEIRPKRSYINSISDNSGVNNE